MGRSYSTQDVRAEQGFSYWQDLVGGTYAAPTENQQLSEGKFEGSLEVKSLGQSALITFIQSSPIEYREGAEASFSDDYFICLSLCPEAHLTQNNIHSTIYPGDIVIYDNNQPFTYCFPQGDKQIVIAVPHAVLDPLVTNVANILNVPLRSGSPLGKFVGAMFQQAWDAPELDEVFGEDILHTLIKALNTAYLAASDVKSQLVTKHRRDNLSRVKAFVQQNLANLDLSVEMISQNMHMSARTLSRLFSKDNTSVMRWVWLQRLKACHRDLLASPERAVSDIAFQHGFSNMPHFSRLFKETYGVTPTQLRQP